jgi:predicted transcriptional regulator
MLTLSYLRKKGGGMEKIFSARLDEAILDELDRVTRRLGMTKKQFLEEAIRLRAQQLNGEAEVDVWAETLGAWKRAESPQTTIRTARRAFQRSFGRHQRGRDARLR